MAEKSEPLIVIREVYDPEAPEREYREYNYLARVVVAGTWREHYFEQLPDALSWANETCEALWLRFNEVVPTQGAPWVGDPNGD